MDILVSGTTTSIDSNIVAMIELPQIKTMLASDYANTDGTERTGEFIVDQTLGRDVRMTVDYQANGLDKVILLLPDGTEQEFDSDPNDVPQVYVANFGNLEVRSATAAALSDTHDSSMIISARHLRVCSQHNTTVEFCQHCHHFKGCSGHSALRNQLLG